MVLSCIYPVMTGKIKQYALVEKVLVAHGGILSGRGLMNKEEALVKLDG